MSEPERDYGVWLHDVRIGTLHQRGDYTWFVFTSDYLNDPDRAVLGLAFEENLKGRVASALRLPPWFSNLLPEGRLREWIADDRGVSADREMELLAQVGRDLPGAVRVLAEDQDPGEPASFHVDDLRLDSGSGSGVSDSYEPGWRFSLAGVGLKFSMVRRGERLTLPAFGEGGDWIVKFPDPMYADVPRNEHAMMSLAAAAGLNIPENILVHRDKLVGVPDAAWQSTEDHAYAVRRFDRTSTRSLVHIEDLAQVRNVYPHLGGKYRGNFETVASLIYRGRDSESLREFARRIAFNILISNGDAHLKNWSLIYRDRRVPSLSPAYDLVATSYYSAGDGPEDMGLKFGNTRRFDQVNLSAFNRLRDRLGAPVDLAECVVETVDQVNSHWPEIASLLEGNPKIQDSVDASISAHTKTLMRLHRD